MGQEMKIAGIAQRDGIVFFETLAVENYLGSGVDEHTRISSCHPCWRR